MPLSYLNEHFLLLIDEIAHNVPYKFTYTGYIFLYNYFSFICDPSNIHYGGY